MTSITFHADLSDAHPGEHHLWANGVLHPIREHTAETRAMALASATHFAEVHDLPHDCAIRVHLRHTTADGEVLPGHVAMLIPGATQHVHLDYVSTAKSLLFHHPDLITNDPEVAAIIHEHLDGNPQITSRIVNDIAAKMRQLGPPRRGGGGWADLVPRTVRAHQLKGVDKDTVRYEIHPVPEIRELMGDTMTLLLKVTKNDLRLKNRKWHQQTGQSVRTEPRLHAMAAEREGTGTWKPALADDRQIDGVDVSIELKDAANREIEMTMRNYRIRYLAAYIRFWDANDQAIHISSWRPEGNDVDVAVVEELGIKYDDCHYLGFLSPVANIFAIPIYDSPGELTIRLRFPENAVRASIYGSGLGEGNNDWPNTPLIGGVLTGLVNLGIPSYMLARRVAAGVNRIFYDRTAKIMETSTLRRVLLGAGIVYFAGSSANAGRPNTHALLGMSQLLFNEGAADLLLAVEAQTESQEVLEAIPFAGWILMALDIATGIAQIAQTMNAITSSDWNIEHSVATSITSKVTVHPDPRHGAFPQAASGSFVSYVVRMIFNDGRPTVIYERSLPPDTPQTLSAEFPNNTLGHKVRFEVDYHINSWRAGTASTPWLNNDEISTTEVHLYLIENPKPITESTRYIHSAILVTEPEGNLSWMTDAPAPTATISQRGDLWNWFGLAVSQRAGMLGFAWNADGTGLRTGPDGAAGRLSAFESVYIPGKPMDSSKLSRYGFIGKTQLMVDPYPAKFLKNADGNWTIGADGKPVPDPKDVLLGDYYLDPRGASLPLSRGGGYHLRPVTMDGSTPFDLDSRLSYGRFELEVDAFAMHPAGFVIGVSQRNAKIQVLRIPHRPSDDAHARIARSYAGEALHEKRDGLLLMPIAVSCSYDGTIFVLENMRGRSQNASARVQAFDVHGNPVRCFTGDDGHPSPFLTVGDTATTVLDVAAVGNELATYVYVLSYRNDGANVSDYQVAIYTRGTRMPPNRRQPLVTVQGVAAAKIALDMWHTMYTLNWAMITNRAGQPYGPPAPEAGPHGRTMPSVSEWIPSVG